ncbi:hypothetical protein PVAND_004859 [Polypedilum vanderplanki]|uniref:Uncharacterized protein n=1 Tax=Polypedilum vanderplanki TaxID=319348 RepID=A0A9J6BYU1_POLVA|nr:hypothetical protein PVAND_004859 [Polypedilum vanderplanki]
MDFKSLMNKAKAFETKCKQDKQHERYKSTKQKIHKELPKIEENKIDERVILEYMEVLRQTQKNIGEELYDKRVKDKREEKFKNINFLKDQIQRNKNKNSLKQKIKMMRKQAIFPQPKSYMNYRNRNGLLKKNSIKIN